MTAEGNAKSPIIDWNPMADAPRDGTVIIVPFYDYSGVQAIRWGDYANNPSQEGWFQADWSDEAAIGKDCPGWLPCPQKGWPE